MIEIKNVKGETIRVYDGDSLVGANLSGAYLSYAYLSYANLSGANLSYANLSGANLPNANLRGAYLGYANLLRANLSGANLGYANLSGADLSGANLRGANLRGANLSYANLSYANLSYVNLSGADLSGANLRGANLRGAKIALNACDLLGFDDFCVLADETPEGMSLTDYITLKLKTPVNSEDPHPLITKFLSATLDEVEDVLYCGQQGKYQGQEPSPDFGYHMEKARSHLELNALEIDPETGKQHFKLALVRLLLACEAFEKTVSVNERP